MVEEKKKIWKKKKKNLPCPERYAWVLIKFRQKRVFPQSIHKNDLRCELQ